MSSNAVPSFSCSCPLGYSASLCEIPVPNACDTGPCQHGGTCILRTLDNYTCACPPRFRGAKCEAVDYCARHPCKNGAQCTSLANGHRCTCAPGFTNETCAVDIDECKRNPCVHGRCVNTHGSYKFVLLFVLYWLLSSTICWSFLWRPLSQPVMIVKWLRSWLDIFSRLTKLESRHLTWIFKINTTI